MQGVKRKRNYGEHCETEVSRSTLYRHKTLFFDVSTRTWIKASEADHVGTYHSSPGSSSSGSEEDRESSSDNEDDRESIFEDDCEPEDSVDADNSSVDVQRSYGLPASAVTDEYQSFPSNPGR